MIILGGILVVIAMRAQPAEIWPTVRAMRCRRPNDHKGEKFLGPDGSLPACYPNGPMGNHCQSQALLPRGLLGRKQPPAHQLLAGGAHARHAFENAKRDPDRQTTGKTRQPNLKQLYVALRGCTNCTSSAALVQSCFHQPNRGEGSGGGSAHHQAFSTGFCGSRDLLHHCRFCTTNRQRVDYAGLSGSTPNHCALCSRITTLSLARTINNSS